jgi:hypothetical protein
MKVLKLKNSSPFRGSLSEDKVSSFLLLATILVKQKDQFSIHSDLYHTQPECECSSFKDGAFRVTYTSRAHKNLSYYSNFYEIKHSGQMLVKYFDTFVFSVEFLGARNILGSMSYMSILLRLSTCEPPSPIHLL